MTNRVSGIAALLQNAKFTVEDLLDFGGLFAEMQKTASVSKAGKANSGKLSKLRDLAFEVYLHECTKLLKNNPEAQRLLGTPAPRKGLLKMIRPVLRVFYRSFLDAADDSNQSWNDFERDKIKHFALSDRNNSTLRGWWRNMNSELDDLLKNY
jgi:hypothetical protein